MAALFLYLYLAAVILRPHEYIGFLTGFPLPMVLELVTLLFWCLHKKNLSAVQVKAVILLNVCIGISWISLSINEGISATFQFFASQALVLILISDLITSVEKHRKVFFVIVASAVIMSLHAHYQLLSPDKTGWTGVKAFVRTDSGETPVWQPRFVGTFSDPNDMGMLLACSVPMFIYFWYTAQRKLSKLCWLASLLFVIYGVYLTNSRGTMLAIAAPFMLYFVIRYNVIKAVLPIAIMLPFALVLLPSRMFISNDQSSMDRIEAWYQGYLMFKSHPLFGVGISNFVDHHHKTAHNSWVLAFAELGFVGFYFWMLIIVASLYTLYHYLRVGSDEFSEKSMNPELVKKELLLVSATFYSMVSALVAAFFLSRTYSVLIYLFSGLSIASMYRLQMLRPDIELKGVNLITFLLSLIIIAVIIFIVMFMD